MENRQVNLHTHSRLCGHASGELADYCRAALRAGIRVLAFTDHVPFPPGMVFRNCQMDWTDLSLYRQWIEECRRDFPELTILAGLETDWDPRFPDGFYEEQLLRDFKLDFLFASAHYLILPDGGQMETMNSGMTEEFLDIYEEKCRKTLECPWCKFLGHPDGCAAGLKEWTPEVEAMFRRICRTAKKFHKPLEINTYGLRKKLRTDVNPVRPPYPWEPLWKLAGEEGITCVINSDAHRPEDIAAGFDTAYGWAAKYHVPCVNAALAERILKRCGR